MMNYPAKKKVYIKTFLETDAVEIDKEINYFRESNEVIAILSNFAFNSKDIPHFHYVVFYYKKE